MDLDRRETDRLIAVVAVATLPLGILAAVFAGFEFAVAVFVLGWLLVVPVLGVLGDQGPDGEGSADDHEDPLETLRARYAAGDLSDEEFEAKLQRLVATEAIPEDAIQPSAEGREDGPGEFATDAGDDRVRER